MKSLMLVFGLLFLGVGGHASTPTDSPTATWTPTITLTWTITKTTTPTLTTTPTPSRTPSTTPTTSPTATATPTPAASGSTSFSRPGYGSPLYVTNTTDILRARVDPVGKVPGRFFVYLQAFKDGTWFNVITLDAFHGGYGVTRTATVFNTQYLRAKVIQFFPQYDSSINVVFGIVSYTPTPTLTPTACVTPCP